MHSQINNSSSIQSLETVTCNIATSDSFTNIFETSCSMLRFALTRSSSARHGCRLRFRVNHHQYRFTFTLAYCCELALPLSAESILNLLMSCNVYFKHPSQSSFCLRAGEEVHKTRVVCREMLDQD